MRPLAQRIGLGLWILLLLAVGLIVTKQLHPGGDLRSFMPPAVTEDQHLLMDQLADGSGSRVLMLAIHGHDDAQVAGFSRELTKQLSADPQYVHVFNGGEDPRAMVGHVLAYRYLLVPAEQGVGLLTASGLRQQLQDRLDDLSSPAASLIEPWLSRDPTLATAALAERWAPPDSPRLQHGVWFSSQHEALLVVQTRAGGFDLEAQQAAVQGIQQAFSRIAGGQAQLKLSGPGYFSVMTSAATRRQADWMGLASGLGFSLLLWLAYRSWSPLLLSALPMASGALAGLVMLSCWFSSVHGITLAFGITLLGVAQEYPLRLLSHRRLGEQPTTTVRRLWPLLMTAIISASIAYAAFYMSHVPGLMQLAVFTVTALLVAGICTRYVLPHLLPSAQRDVASTPGLMAFRHWLDRLPRPRWLASVVGLLSLAGIVLAPGPFWQNDLSALTPINPSLLQQDGYLRHALGVADLRYMLVIPGVDQQAVLTHSEQLAAVLKPLQSRGVLTGLRLPSDYLPSLMTQAQRQRALPDDLDLRASLQAAQQGLPFHAGLFAPFMTDVATARRLALLTPAQFEQWPMGQALAAQLVPQHDHWLGLATVSSIRDPLALQHVLQAMPGHPYVLDLKAVTESLVAAYRQRMLWALAWAGGLLVLAVMVALRSRQRACRVLVPMSLATLLVVAVECSLGLPLSLFHLIALVLAAGLGLHYALFF